MSVVEHKGIVIELTNTHTIVEILVSSACASCSMKGGCISSAESDKRVVKIERKSGENYKIGDNVILFFEEKMGAKIVLLAYIIPVIICVLAIYLMLQSNISEPITALLSLLFIFTYFIILYIFRREIQARIVIKIKNLI